jgi:hypothetical protein
LIELISTITCALRATSVDLDPVITTHVAPSEACKLTNFIAAHTMQETTTIVRRHIQFIALIVLLTAACSAADTADDANRATAALYTYTPWAVAYGKQCSGKHGGSSLVATLFNTYEKALGSTSTSTLVAEATTDLDEPPGP